MLLWPCVAGTFLQAEEATAQAEPAKAEAPELVLETWGWFVAQSIDLRGDMMSESGVAAFVRGLKVASEGRPVQINFERLAPSIQSYLDHQRESEEPTPWTGDASEVEVLYALGYWYGSNFELHVYDLSDAEFSRLQTGFQSGLRQEPAPADLEEIGPHVLEFLQARSSSVEAHRLEQARAVEGAFFDELDARPGIQQTASGLRYEVTKEGEGNPPGPTDQVTVHYTGTLVDGTVFDSSHNRGTPTTFPLNRVIAGWTEGLQLVAPGGSIKLYIPSRLAYGDDGRPGIPPGAPLVFEVDLIKVDPAIPGREGP